MQKPCAEEVAKEKPAGIKGVPAAKAGAKRQLTREKVRFEADYAYILCQLNCNYCSQFMLQSSSSGSHSDVESIEPKVKKRPIMACRLRKV